MSNSIKICSAVLFLVVTGPLMLHAQVPSDTLFQLDTLRVEAIRLNISSDNVPLSLKKKTRSGREITGDASLSLASITHGLPGVWVSNRHNAALGARITIRGLGWRSAWGVRGIQLVLNGIPLTLADGSSVTNIIDPAFILLRTLN